MVGWRDRCPQDHLVKVEVEIGVQDNEIGVEYEKVDFEVDGKLRILGAEVGSCRDGPVGGGPR